LVTYLAWPQQQELVETCWGQQWRSCRVRKRSQWNNCWSTKTFSKMLQACPRWHRRRSTRL